MLGVVVGSDEGRGFGAKFLDAVDARLDADIKFAEPPSVPKDAFDFIQYLHDAIEREIGLTAMELQSRAKSESRNLTAADAMASVRPEVRAAKALAKIQKNSSGAAVRLGARMVLRDGVPCGHPGCLSHISHPCEGCGRIGGRSTGGDEWVKRMAAEEDGALVGAAGSPVEETRWCSECFKSLVHKKSKWACSDVACGMYGIEV